MCSIRSRFGLALLISVAQLGTAGQDMTIRVEKTTVSLTSTSDAEVSSYKLLLDLRITNTGTLPLTVGAFPVITSAVQRVRNDGTRHILSQSSWYGTKNTVYSTCFVLAPGESTMIRNAESGLTLLNSQFNELGNDPALVFSLQILCRDADGSLKGTKEVASEPVTVKLPPITQHY